MNVFSLWRGQIERQACFSDMLADWCEETGFSVGQIKGRGSAQDVQEARQDFMLIAYATGQWSYPQIGRWLGGRHHTTILHGVRQSLKRAAERDGAGS